MENFNWTQFTKRIFIKSELALVYNAWTKSEELEKWFLSKAAFYTADRQLISASTDVTANSQYE